MVDTPADIPVTTPTLVIVATPVFEDNQGLVTAAVPLPENVVLKPKHTDALAGVIVGRAFTVTVVIDEVAEQPLALVAVTL